MADRRFFYVNLFTAIFLSTLIVPATGAQASTHKHKHRHHASVTYSRPAPASFVVDVDTGNILESENADAPRYPASLTKMMTLYLTFDALKKGKLSLNETIPVSEHASSMPQTNISLEPGERIAVKDAILSIVVRSANDSAVTLGEALGGGSEEAFAEKMTEKAHALGMKHTVFYNASGLPNPDQHTTARDMATLGLALRKNFPQYFPFFKTESFSYRGLTYVTHNHVMMRYEGVDGIKTGYIRASGYNLVTSATRDNHHLIGVVLGGSTIRGRDDKMIAMLDKEFADLSTLPGNRAASVQYASSGRRIPAFPTKTEKMEEAMEGEGDRPGDDVIPTDSLHASAASGSTPPVDSKSPIVADRAQAEPPEQKADLSSGGWGIQVGAFARMKDAEDAANQAMEIAPAELKTSTVSLTDDTDKADVHRARLVNLDEASAESACQKLTAQHQPCFVYRVD